MVDRPRPLREGEGGLVDFASSGYNFGFSLNGNDYLNLRLGFTSTWIQHWIWPLNGNSCCNTDASWALQLCEHLKKSIDLMYKPYKIRSDKSSFLRGRALKRYTVTVFEPAGGMGERSGLSVTSLEIGGKVTWKERYIWLQRVVGRMVQRGGGEGSRIKMLRVTY